MLLDFEKLNKWMEKPEPFTPGQAMFWVDPYISQHLLAAHLDPNSDLASRRTEKIDTIVTWLCETLQLKPGDALLDMGCGPGLYTSRFAERGMSVTGIDFSQRSIDYARVYAASHHLKIDYRCQNYLDLDEENKYDIVLHIYGDYCTFSPEQRRKILRNVKRALKPDGFFVLDVTTEATRQKYGLKKNWYLSEGGFWRPGDHMVLEQGFSYPELKIYLDQYIVIEDRGAMVVYRNWFQDFTREMITEELEDGGFEVVGLWGDLMGNPCCEGDEWIGVIAEKKD